jgi:hypothetical protein
VQGAAGECETTEVALPNLLVHSHQNAADKFAHFPRPATFDGKTAAFGRWRLAEWRGGQDRP